MCTESRPGGGEKVGAGCSARGRRGKGFTLAVKRATDLSLCALLSVLCIPVMILFAGLIKCSSPGSVFFVQERAGYRGKGFRMIKFRTMVPRKQTVEPMEWSEAEEERITRLGRFLRDYGLDELPQLYNILRGDMSIVGPRPPLPGQAAGFTARQRRMFEMRPGVLSWAAVQGRRSISPEQRIALHAWYVDHWSLRLDLRILWHSLVVVLRRQDAVELLPRSGRKEQQAHPEA
jgi:sugar transferase EpsL